MILFPAFDRYLHAAAWLLMVVVGLVLLIACTNLTSFVPARGVERRKEMALRVALGAKRRTLMGQLLAEAILLGLAGGVAGVVLAAGLLQVLAAADLPLPIPIALDLSLDVTVLGFCCGISLLAGVLLGLAPAIRSTNLDMASVLRDESTGGGALGRVTLRNGLVVAQVAGSLVLLAGAGFFEAAGIWMVRGRNFEEYYRPYGQSTPPHYYVLARTSIDSSSNKSHERPWKPSFLRSTLMLWSIDLA